MVLRIVEPTIELIECPECNGTGSNLYTGEDCEECCGTGFQPEAFNPDGSVMSDDQYVQMIRDAVSTTARPTHSILDY